MGRKEHWTKIKTIVDVIHENPELRNLEIKELSAGESIEIDNIKVLSFLAKHNLDIKAFCYRFESDNKIFAYSGDTVESED